MVALNSEPVERLISRWKKATLGSQSSQGRSRRIAVVSDVHGCLGPLIAVLDDAVERGATEIWCLGDVAGRGPFARECIGLLDALDHSVSVWLAGNHDLALLSDQSPYRLQFTRKEDLDAITEQTRDLVQGVGSRNLSPIVFGSGDRLMIGARRRRLALEHVCRPIDGGPVIYATHGGAPRGSETVASRYTDSSLAAVSLLEHAQGVAVRAELPEPSLMVVGHAHGFRAFHGTNNEVVATRQGPLVHEVRAHDWACIDVGSTGGWVRGSSGLGGTYAVLNVAQNGVSCELVALRVSARSEIEALRESGRHQLERALTLGTEVAG